MNNWKVFSSTDMVNWTDRGSVHYTTLSWSKGDAWASQVIERNGKFYWYVSTEHKTDAGKAIGVMVANSPTGPWTDARGTALITNSMTPGTTNWGDIDPTVFIDDDGQAYMYWGNDVLFYVKLNADMISFSGSIVNVPINTGAFGPDYTEAPFLHKRGSTYYMSYASSWPESISYSTSNSPTGPWTYRGVIQPATTTSTTSHQSFIEFNGQNYFISHNGALPTGGDYRRSVIIEKFNYSDGTIPTILQTSTGVDGVMNRLQSYNFQDRYVRHANYDARIDSNVAPAEDQYWEIVPGLANSGSGYVSIQSVYFPGYYLRHSNFDFVLEKHDGSSLFAADATFRIVN
jgi:beta-xylosidase